MALLAVAAFGSRAEAQSAALAASADSWLFSGSPEEAAERWAEETRTRIAWERRQNR